MDDGYYWGPNARLSALHTDLVNALRAQEDTTQIVLAVGHEVAALRGAHEDHQVTTLVSV